MKQLTLPNRPDDTGGCFVVRHVRDMLLDDSPDGPDWRAAGFATYQRRTWSVVKWFEDDHLDPDDLVAWQLHTEISEGGTR